MEICYFLVKRKKRSRDQEIKTTQKWEFYAAALQAEIRRSWVKNPGRVVEEKFVKEFHMTSDGKPPKQELPEEEKERRRKVQMDIDKGAFAIISAVPMKPGPRIKRNT